jgi:hypothetical protein
MKIHRLLNVVSAECFNKTVIFLHNLISNEMLNDVMSKPQLLNPDLYTFSLYENSSFIIVSADRIYFDNIIVFFQYYIFLAVVAFVG